MLVPWYHLAGADLMYLWLCHLPYHLVFPGTPLAAHVGSCNLFSFFINVVLCCQIQVAQMGGQPEQGNREQVGAELKA